VFVADHGADAGQGAFAEPVARSPISLPGPHELRNGWRVATRASTATLTLSDASSLTKVVVRAAADGPLADTLPAFGRADRDGPVLRVGSGPGEWILLAAAPGDPLATALPQSSAEFVSVIDVTHGRALIRLTGADSARALAKVCAVNLSDGKAPDGTALRTSVASVTTDIVRDDHDGTRSYLLHCERSSGQFLFDSLFEAGAEYGAETTGLAGHVI